VDFGNHHANGAANVYPPHRTDAEQTIDIQYAGLEKVRPLAIGIKLKLSFSVQ
jgi:hypothetical protein